MNQDPMLRHLRHANRVARAAMEAGHHPFGSLLIAPDNETVLLEQRNVDSVNHGEAVLAREAARLHAPAMLWGCTLVTTVEPCVMCAGTQYYIRAIQFQELVVEARWPIVMQEHQVGLIAKNHPAIVRADRNLFNGFAGGEKLF